MARGWINSSFVYSPVRILCFFSSLFLTFSLFFCFSSFFVNKRTMANTVTSNGCSLIGALALFISSMLLSYHYQRLTSALNVTGLFICRLMNCASQK
jgi:hypothetical protein